MEVTGLSADTFWKGETEIRGFVTDGGKRYRVRILRKGSQIFDYSCSHVEMSGRRMKDCCVGCGNIVSESDLCVHGQMLLAEPAFIGAFPVKDGNNVDSYDYEVTAVNSRNYVLPMTGGEGDFTLCTWSAAILSVIICLMIMKKEKEIKQQ